MSLYAQLQSASTSAQRTLAQMQGAATASTTNFTLAGTAYQGVINENRVEMPGVGDGIEVIRELQITVTRTQFTAKPDPTTRPTVVALGETWYLTNCGESALHYFLTARPA